MLSSEASSRCARVVAPAPSRVVELFALALGISICGCHRAPPPPPPPPAAVSTPMGAPVQTPPTSGAPAGAMLPISTTPSSPAPAAAPALPPAAVPPGAMPPGAMPPAGVPLAAGPTAAVPTEASAAVASADAASAAAARADATVCAAALRCCDAVSHSVRGAARREGVDLRDRRYDPRRTPDQDRYDPGYGYGDPRDDPRVRRAASRLISGCQALRHPDQAHAERCGRQIEAIRHALREAGAPIPSACRVPETTTAPTTNRAR